MADAAQSNTAVNSHTTVKPMDSGKYHYQKSCMQTLNKITQWLMLYTYMYYRDV